MVNMVNGIAFNDTERAAQMAYHAGLLAVVNHIVAYHMATDKGEVLIPAIPDVIIEVDIKGNVLRLRPMKGLLDDDEI